MKIWIMAVMYPGQTLPTIEYFDDDKLTALQKEVLLQYHRDIDINCNQFVDINAVFREKLNMPEDDCWNDVLAEAYIPDISGKEVQIVQSMPIVIN